jgi:alpha-beta hydrolase superfamily lysophospholipase
MKNGELKTECRTDQEGWNTGLHTAGDGYRWCYRHYPAPAVARAHAVCIHGIQSHAGWYSHSCSRLAAAGFDVSFLDRRGSGRNEMARGDTPSFRRLLDDIAEYLRDQRAQQALVSKLCLGTPVRAADPEQSLGAKLNGAGPVFLVGISWGAKLAVALTRRHPGLIDGLILVAPGFSPRVSPALRERLSIVLARIVNPRRLFPVPLNEPELFTATPRWLEFLRHDPLAIRHATARFFIESVRLDWYLRFAVGHITLPILTLLAEKDRIIDNARTRAFIDRFPSRDKQIIEYPGAHHTLEFAPDPEPFIRDIVAWLDRHTSIDGHV